MQDAVALAGIRRPHTRDPTASTEQEARKASRSVKRACRGRANEAYSARTPRTSRKNKNEVRVEAGVGARGDGRRGVRKTRRPNHHGCVGIIFGHTHSVVLRCSERERLHKF